MHNSSNSSTGPPGTEEAGLSLGLVYLLVSSLVLITNAIAMLVLANTKMFRDPTVLIITNMTFWDFMQGLNVLIFAVPSAFLNKFAYRREVLGFAACVSSFLVGITALNTASMVLDRFLSVKYPLLYRNFTTTHAGVLVFILIAVAATRMCLIVFPDNDFYFAVELSLPVSNFNSIQGMLASVVSTSFTFGAIIMFSFVILINLKSRNRCTHALRHVTLSKRMVRVSLMVVASAGVYCLSFVPLMICVVINYVNGMKKVPIVFVQVAVVCAMSNSISNVVIYTSNSQVFRDSLIRIFCKSYYLNQRRQRQIGNNDYNNTAFSPGNEVDGQGNAVDGQGNEVDV